MKNFLLVLALALGVIGAVVSFVGIQKTEEVEKTYVDSAAVVKLFESQMNPSFTTVEQVLAYKKAVYMRTQEDSIFNTLSPQTLTDVTTVVVNKKGSATPSDIVEEFKKNNGVYDNLHPVATEDTPPDDKVQNAIDSTINSKVGPMSITYKDTTINGRPAREKTVTSVTYE